MDLSLQAFFNYWIKSGKPQLQTSMVILFSRKGENWFKETQC